MRTHMTLLALAALVCTSLATARPGGPGGFAGFGGPGFAMHLLKELDLTQEQKDKIRALREANRDAMKKLRQAAKDSRKAVKDAMAGADDATLTKLFNDAQSKHQAMVSAGFDQMLKVRAVLTAEQRKKLLTLLEERRPRGPRGGHGRDHGPGPEGDEDED